MFGNCVNVPVVDVSVLYDVRPCAPDKMRKRPLAQFALNGLNIDVMSFGHRVTP
jgi:hypothetical protein